MRLMLAVMALATTATQAAAEEDRYGPARPVSENVRSAGQSTPGAFRTAAVSAAYQGPFLSWAGKVEPNTGAAQAPAALRPSPPMNAPPAMSAPAAAPRAAARPAPQGDLYAPVEVRRGTNTPSTRLAFPQTPPPATRQTTVAPRPAAPPVARAAPPQSLYAPSPEPSAPRRAPVVTAPPAPTRSVPVRVVAPPPGVQSRAAAPPPVQRAPAGPAVTASAPAPLPPVDPTRPWLRLGMSSAAPVAPQPAAESASSGDPLAPGSRQQAAAPVQSGVVGGRFYSVRRNFGQEPDPIPTPDRSAGPVLVGPGPATQMETTTGPESAGGVGAEPEETTPRPRRNTTPSSSTR